MFMVLTNTLLLMKLGMCVPRCFNTNTLSDLILLKWDKDKHCSVPEKTLKVRFKGQNKKAPTAKTIALMMPRLKYDYDFYYFVVQRFFEMYRTFG